MDSNLVHDNKLLRFVCDFGECEAELEYRKIDDNTLEYYRTFVPPEYRHQNVGSKLAEFALTYAAENGLRVVPSCTFVARFIQLNPQYAYLVKR